MRGNSAYGAAAALAAPERSRRDRPPLLACAGSSYDAPREATNSPQQAHDQLADSAEQVSYRLDETSEHGFSYLRLQSLRNEYPRVLQATPIPSQQPG